MAEIDDVVGHPLGREFVHAGSIAGHHVHERAPRASAISHNNSNCMFALLLSEVLNLEETLLGETCIVHVDYWICLPIRILLVEVRPLSGKRLDAFMAPTPIRHLSRLVLANLRDTRHVGRRQFTALDPFRTGVALVLNVDLSLGSTVGQYTPLYLLTIGISHSIIDDLSAIR